MDIPWADGRVSLRTGMDTVKKMKMDATGSSETLVSTYQTTSCHNPADHKMNLHNHEYRNSRKLVTVYQFALNNIRGK